MNLRQTRHDGSCPHVGCKRLLASATPLIMLVGGCPSPDPPPAQSNCGNDDPRIGQTAVLVAPPLTNIPNFDHDVSGTAVIVDNCTIVIENFNYDGNALDARVAGILNANFLEPIFLTANLSRPEPYRDATLTIPLPEGVTLDEVRHIAVVCAPFRLNFGDGHFE